MALRTLHSNTAWCAGRPIPSAPHVPTTLHSSDNPAQDGQKEPSHLTHPVVCCVLDVVQPSHPGSWSEKKASLSPWSMSDSAVNRAGRLAMTRGMEGCRVSGDEHREKCAQGGSAHWKLTKWWNSPWDLLLSLLPSISDALCTIPF